MPFHNVNFNFAIKQNSAEIKFSEFIACAMPCNNTSSIIQLGTNLAETEMWNTQGFLSIYSTCLNFSHNVSKFSVSWEKLCGDIHVDFSCFYLHDFHVFFRCFFVLYIGLNSVKYKNCRYFMVTDT